MPINVQCPQCSRQLGVPDTLIGKKVKCPSCQTVFTAEAPGAAAAPPPPPPLPDDEPEAPRPSSARRRDPDDVGGSPPSGDRETARAKVNAPAIALIVVGILGLLSSLGFGCGGIATPSVSKDGDVQQAAGAYYTMGCCGLLTLIPCGLAIYGGMKMRSLENSTMAMVGSIASMFIWTCCACVPGIAVGIWALMVLNNPEVKAAFR